MEILLASLHGFSKRHISTLQIQRKIYLSQSMVTATPEELEKGWERVSDGG